MDWGGMSWRGCAGANAFDPLKPAGYEARAHFI